MKIKAKSPSLVSSKLIVPFDGAIDIDANGVADVSPQAAEILVNGTSDWSYLSDVKVEADEADANENKSVIDGIKSMPIADLLIMAAEAGYPESEWSKFSTKPKLMAGYLIKKYNEMQFEAEAEKEVE